MVRGSLFYSSVLMLVSTSGTSCKAAEQNSVSQDTSVLARSEKAFTIDSGHPYYQVALNSTGKDFSGDMKIILVLDGPVVGQNPDGVYEVYVTRGLVEHNSLSSSHTGFVNVLDLYALTSPDSPGHLVIDLTKNAGVWVKDDKALPALTLTIRFRGNQQSSGTESTQAGKLTVKGIRIVQER